MKGLRAALNVGITTDLSARRRDVLVAVALNALLSTCWLPSGEPAAGALSKDA